MKAHTSQFKDKIKEFGRQLDSIITYTINNEDIELGNEQLNSVSPHYEGAILKSVMKQLDIDSNVEIPVGTVLNYQFGVKVRNNNVVDYRDNYDYIDYGNYVVKDVEKQEDTRSYKITCYDKMLYFMKEYDNADIIFPITIREYIETICDKADLTFADTNTPFANYDKVINNELYLDNEGNSLGYTFRDVLDELAQVTGGTICINEDDELEVRYIHDVGELQTASGSNITIPKSEAIELQEFELEGKTTQADTPTPDNPSELVSVGYKNLFDIDGDLYGGDIIRYKNGFELIKGTNRTLSLNLSTPLESGTYIFNSKIVTNTLTNINKLILTFRTNSSALGNVYLDSNGYATFTLNDTATRLYVYINNDQSDTANIVLDDIIISKIKHDYIPYGKYGVEVKTESENLKSKTTWSSGYLNNNNEVVSNTSWQYSNYIDISNGNYIYTNTGTGNAPKTVLYDSNKNPIEYLNVSVRTVDLSSYNATYIRISVAITDFNGLVLCQTNTQLYVLDNPLRSIGDTKDLLYIKNGMLYVERKIGSVVLDGSESWTRVSNNDNTYRFTIPRPTDSIGSTTNILCNYFKAASNYTTTDNSVYFGSGNLIISRVLYNETYITTVNDFKTWLSTHNTEVQYILAEAYTEELGQVQIPSTYKGITYINTTDDLEPTMNISYISEFDVIDEEYLKDVNVNFGEKFGAVNTIVLSRGGDGDKIKYPDDIPDDERIAIQITDNQIMNGNDRDEYMPDIWQKLNGLEYYINDFTSTGICYYDLCDRYRVKIGDTIYKCIMFNDSVEITQGLKEDIYTDMQEENEQEYQYMSSTDRGITQANIIAKKNEATITEYTQKVDDANNRLNAVETKQTETDRTINIMSTNIDDNGNITEVTTTTGFTFNADGMTISDSGTNFYALHRNDGTYYYDGGLDNSNIVGQYTKDGSKQKDLELFGTYYYGKEDINDTPMFVAQLYSDENGEECVGHFWNLGD